MMKDFEMRDFLWTVMGHRFERMLKEVTLHKRWGSWIDMGVETNISLMMKTWNIRKHMLQIWQTHTNTCSLMPTYMAGSCLVQMLVNRNTNCEKGTMEPHEAKDMSIFIRSNRAKQVQNIFRQRPHWKKTATPLTKFNNDGTDVSNQKHVAWYFSQSNSIKRGSNYPSNIVHRSN